MIPYLGPEFVGALLGLDSTKRETLTPLRDRSVAFSLWDRLVHWLNKHTGVRER